MPILNYHPHYNNTYQACYVLRFRLHIQVWISGRPSLRRWWGVPFISMPTFDDTRESGYAPRRNTDTKHISLVQRTQRFHLRCICRETESHPMPGVRADSKKFLSSKHEETKTSHIRNPKHGFKDIRSRDPTNFVLFSLVLKHY